MLLLYLALSNRLPIVPYRRNRCVKPRTSGNPNTTQCFLHGLKEVKVNTMLVILLLVPSSILPVFKHGFYLGLYVTIQKHILNKVSPFVDLCLHVLLFIYWYISSIADGQGFSQRFSLLVFVCV